MSALKILVYIDSNLPKRWAICTGSCHADYLIIYNRCNCKHIR